MSAIYICYFNFVEFSEWVSGLECGRVKLPSTDPHIFIRNCEIPDIATAKEGFWLNSNFEFTKCSDARYWISAGAVINVRKVES